MSKTVAKTGDRVDVYVGNLYQGRGIVVALKNGGTMAEVETYDLCHYACPQEDLEVIDE